MDEAILEKYLDCRIAGQAKVKITSLQGWRLKGFSFQTEKLIAIKFATSLTKILLGKISQINNDRCVLVDIIDQDAAYNVFLHSSDDEAWMSVVWKIENIENNLKKLGFQPNENHLYMIGQLDKYMAEYMELMTKLHLSKRLMEVHFPQEN